jgi:hypothetical protein
VEEHENPNTLDRHVKFKHNGEEVYAIFHQWGNTFCDDVNGGRIPMTCAIVEDYNGRVYVPYPHEIRFVIPDDELDKYKDI